VVIWLPHGNSASLSRAELLERPVAIERQLVRNGRPAPVSAAGFMVCPAVVQQFRQSWKQWSRQGQDMQLGLGGIDQKDGRLYGKNSPEVASTRQVVAPGCSL